MPSFNIIAFNFSGPLHCVSTTVGLNRGNAIATASAIGDLPVTVQFYESQTHCPPGWWQVAVVPGPAPFYIAIP